MEVTIDELQAKVMEGVKKQGYTDEDTRIITDVILYAQLRGNNQGISQLATGGVPEAGKLEPLRIIKENGCAVLFSGGNAMVASVKAADKATQLAQAHGIGIAASNRTHTTSGAIGYYARIIAKTGFIGFVCVGGGDWGAVAPTGSAEAKLGTNPLAYAFPHEGGEVVFDMATSAMAYYGVMQALLSGEPLPEGAAVNSRGEPTTDPGDVVGRGGNEEVVGAITTFGGYKGFGLSLLVQLLGGPFVRAGFPGGYSEDGAGAFMLAIEPGLLAGKDEYMKRSRKFIDSIKSAKPISGQRVVLPGERGDGLARQAQASGKVSIADGIWSELLGFIQK